MSEESKKLNPELAKQIEVIKLQFGKPEFVAENGMMQYKECMVLPLTMDFKELIKTDK